MQTFEEWLITNHPESLDENWRRTLGSFALGAASFLPMANAEAQQPNVPRVAATQSASQNQQARLDAMKRVSAVHKFKKNWGSKFSPQQDQKLFDTIMRLQTEQDHDDFLATVTKDQKDLMRYTTHPDPDVQRSDIRQIYNSFDYQYMDYIKTLAYASKNNL